VSVSQVGAHQHAAALHTVSMPACLNCSYCLQLLITQLLLWSQHKHSCCPQAPLTASWLH
jgi:hypothetical protein